MIIEEAIIKQEMKIRSIKYVHKEKNSKKAGDLNKDLIKYSTINNQSEIWLSKQKNMESKKILFLEEHKKKIQINLAKIIETENLDPKTDSILQSELSIESYEINRYYTKNITKCFNCNERGHQKRDCLLAKNVCYYCLGNHMRRDCLENYLCFYCNKNGHSKFTCPSRGKSLCYKCKSSEHKSYQCDKNKLDFYEQIYNHDFRFIKCFICFKFGHMNCKRNFDDGNMNKNFNREKSKSYDIKVNSKTGKGYRVLKEEDYDLKKINYDGKKNNFGNRNDNYDLRKNYRRDNFRNNDYYNDNYEKRRNYSNSNKNYEKKNFYSNKNIDNKNNYSNSNKNIDKKNNFFKNDKRNFLNKNDNYNNKYSYNNKETRSSEKNYYKKNKNTGNKYINKFGSKNKSKKNNFFDRN